MKKPVLLSLLIIFVAFLAVSCHKTAKNTFEPKPVVHPEWTRTAVIYEVNVRQYTKEGTFKAFEKYLPQLKDLGIDILWFMPINPISELNGEGTFGNYYTVKDYRAVNPEFGTAEDFKSLVESAHGQGFKVIIDLVASNNGAMRATMTDAMKFWVTDFDIDGFRCDVAGNVPISFWDSTRIVLDSIKPVFMLADAEQPEILANAFDADYAQTLLHLMNNIAKDSSVQTVRDYLLKNDSILPRDAYKMNFITNHYENSFNGTEYERYKNGVEAFAVLTYTLPGMPLIYTGQEIGLKKRLQFSKKDPISWTKNSTFVFYKKLNELKHTHPALMAGTNGGDVKIFNYISARQDVLMFSRSKEGKEIVVVLNLSNKKHDVVANEVFPKGEFIDYFTGKKTQITQPVKLGPWEYKIWVN